MCDQKLCAGIIALTNSLIGEGEGAIRRSSSGIGDSSALGDEKRVNDSEAYTPPSSTSSLSSP